MNEVDVIAFGFLGIIGALLFLTWSVFWLGNVYAVNHSLPFNEELKTMYRRLTHISYAVGGAGVLGLYISFFL